MTLLREWRCYNIEAIHTYSWLDGDKNVVYILPSWIDDSIFPFEPKIGFPQSSWPLQVHYSTLRMNSKRKRKKKGKRIMMGYLKLRTILTSIHRCNNPRISRTTFKSLHNIIPNHNTSQSNRGTQGSRIVLPNILWPICHYVFYCRAHRCLDLGERAHHSGCSNPSW